METEQGEDCDAEEAYSVVFMCIMLSVSRSGYYEWKNRAPSDVERRRERLKLMIKAIFDANHGTYGYRRVHAVLVRSGEQVGDELVRQLMRELDLRPCQPKPWRPVTTQAAGHHRIPDLVRRDFTAGAPGRKLVGDVTYISTRQGWVYLATVIDCFSKMVVGWSMADHFKTPDRCRAGYGRGKYRHRRRVYLPLRPGVELHVLRVREETTVLGYAAIGGSNWGMLG